MDHLDHLASWASCVCLVHQHGLPPLDETSGHLLLFVRSVLRFVTGGDAHEDGLSFRRWQDQVVESIKVRFVCATFGDCVSWHGELPLLALLLKPVFIIFRDVRNLTLSERGDMYSFIDVLQVVLRSCDDGPSSLHIHRDVRHFCRSTAPSVLRPFSVRFEWR